MIGIAEEKTALPVFRQIVVALKNEIVSGSLAEHTALPSERAVAKAHGVSRMTARRALEVIEAEGLAYSKGRQGRFVSPERLDYGLSSMANFISGSAEKGIEIDIELVNSRIRSADGRLARILSVPIDTQLFENTRVFSRSGHATFVETETVVSKLGNAQLCDIGSDQDVPEGQRRYGPLGHSADIVVRMRAFTPAEADLLGVMPYQTGIEQEQIVRDRGGIAFCFCHQIWRGEIAQFSAKAVLQG